MLPPCALPNRCAPTCACHQYGSSGGGAKPLSTFQKVFAGLALGTIALAFAGAFTADAYHARRMQEQKALGRRP
jgi:hypothetical protein